jgi:uncharacterized protein YggE
MKNLISLLIVVFAGVLDGLVVPAATAQEHPTLAAQPNTVFVGADGKFQADPDTALLQFNISAQDKDSHNAYDRASKAADQIRQVLRGNGIDPKIAEVGFFSMQPVYDFQTAQRKLVGYRVSANVSLKLKDFSKLPTILQSLADADLAESQTMSYVLEDIEAAKSRAVEDAYRHARESAAALARAAGRTVGELSYASLDTFENLRPVPLMMAANAMDKARAAVPVTEGFKPQSVTVTAHINALFTLK